MGDLRLPNRIDGRRTDSPVAEAPDVTHPVIAELIAHPPLPTTLVASMSMTRRRGATGVFADRRGTPEETLQRFAELFAEHDFKQLPAVSDGAHTARIPCRDGVAATVRRYREAQRASRNPWG